jgi:uncharacterized DUF497 family protein
VADELDPLDQCIGFDWDDANLDKNWLLHRIAFWEAEEVFFNEPLLLREDPGHSRSEVRFFGLGQTDAGRRLFVGFTVRGNLVRVISARDMTRKEQRVYERQKA